MTQSEIEKYAEKIKVPVSIVKDAMLTAKEEMGEGYVTEYYWQFMGVHLCNFYKLGQNAK